jgi:TRAP-type C4-dicarboxylate transport system permease large subunit
MIKKVAAIVPGPAVVFIGKWFELFSSTPLGYPQWQHDAENIALLIGAFIAIVLCLILKSSPKRLLFAFALAGLVLTLVAVAVCLWIRHHLGTPTTSISDVRWWQDIWEYFYIAAMVLLVATITLAGLYEGEAHPWVFWAVFAIIAAILVGIGVWWWHSSKT